MQKLLAYELNQTEPAAADLAVALARTAFAHPEEARAALALLPQLQHEALRELLHWFLSPDEATLPVVVTAKKAGFAYLTERLSKLLPHDAAAPGTVSDALPWLGAVAARTKFPSRLFPELLPLPASDCPGLAYPWEPQWEFEVTTNTYTERGTTGPHTVTHRSRHISFPATYSGKAAPSPLLLYAQHVRFVGMQHASWLLGADYPFLAALLPLNPSPLYWHAVRTAGWADGLETAERGVIGQALRSLLLPGPAFEASATLVLAIGLTHKTPVCRALALEALLASCDQQRLRPPALGQTLGKLLAAEFVPLQRLTDTLAQARAISPLVDDALHQTLDALLPALPAGALRNTRKLLDAYADLTARSRRPVPAPVQARLHEWQAAPSLKKAAATLLNSC